MRAEIIGNLTHGGTRSPPTRLFRPVFTQHGEGCLHSKAHALNKSLLVLKVLLDSDFIVLLQTNTATHLNLSTWRKSERERNVLLFTLRTIHPRANSPRSRGRRLSSRERAKPRRGLRAGPPQAIAYLLVRPRPRLASPLLRREAQAKVPSRPRLPLSVGGASFVTGAGSLFQADPLAGKRPLVGSTADEGLDWKTFLTPPPKKESNKKMYQSAKQTTTQPFHDNVKNMCEDDNTNHHERTTFKHAS
ncbi:uncharacterized protein LOC143838883 [Paroedura picta]|uniref:uncharacterized protein LOC143838883 n=1 Tax=Paroedura picta TaxID=143630 RepID=UPI00405753A6